MESLMSVREIELEWIPLSDGTHLAARIWLPENSERNPVPAILEYVPYRRRHFTGSGTISLNLTLLQEAMRACA